MAVPIIGQIKQLYPLYLVRFIAFGENENEIILDSKMANATGQQVPVPRVGEIIGFSNVIGSDVKVSKLFEVTKVYRSYVNEIGMENGAKVSRNGYHATVHLKLADEQLEFDEKEESEDVAIQVSNLQPLRQKDEDGNRKRRK